MHPFIPFAALPIAVTAAWFAATHWQGSEQGRYRVPSVQQIENPSVPVDVRSQPEGKPDIRVAVFLPHLPPKPPATVPTLILYSVMTGTEANLATINGQLVKEGDSIEGYQVQRITADGVDLMRGGKNRRLPMRSLHELSPPRQPDTDTENTNTAVQYDETDLNQNLLATFDSPQF